MYLISVLCVTNAYNNNNNIDVHYKIVDLFSGYKLILVPVLHQAQSLQ